MRKYANRYLITSIIATGSIAISQGAPAPKNKKANLLIIITDQQRFDAMSRAGNTILQTPNLDRLAREGVFFKNAYTQCAVCAPARASILTGCTVENHGILTNELSTSSKKDGRMLMPTYDELLSQNGYHCEYYGKWHSPEFHTAVYRNPELYSKNGAFAISIPGLTAFYKDFVDVVYPKPGLEAGQLYDSFTNRPYLVNPLDKRYGMTNQEVQQSGKKYIQPDLHGESLTPVDYSLTAFEARQAIDAIERNKDSTFSITCSFHFPHAPMIPPKPYSDMYPVANMPVPASIADQMLNTPYRTQNGRLQNPEYANPELIKYMESDYYGLVKEIDDWVGKILDKLDELGLTDNTMVIFTSDHGEMLGSHGMREKNVFYEESAHVPLLIRFPGRINPGTTVDGYVSTMNLFATINDYLQMPEYPSDGKSLRGLIEGTDHSMGNYVVTEWLYNQDKQPAYMIVKDKWKLFIPYSAESNVINALYNLNDDPYEMNNLIGNNPYRKNYEAKANELREDILNWLKEHHSAHYDGVKSRDLMKADLSTGALIAPQKQFGIYPNPTTGKVTIDSYAEKINGIRICDLLGRVIHSDDESFTGVRTFDMPAKPGCYIIKVQSKYPFPAQKVIVK